MAWPQHTASYKQFYRANIEIFSLNSVYFLTKSAKKSTNSLFIDKNAKLSTSYERLPMITFGQKMPIFQKNCTFVATPKCKNRRVFVIFREFINNFYGKIHAHFRL